MRRTARRSALARLGDAMVRHRKVIVALQWVVIVAYAVLVALPAFLPLPPAGANMLNNLTLAAQFAFWG
ncbi:MAG: 4Fe-4S binding protein, partial [Giesbergeria sp.]